MGWKVIPDPCGDPHKYKIVKIADKNDSLRAPQLVYFIQEENSGPIKIGCCRWVDDGYGGEYGNPNSRLSSLQVGNPRGLFVIGCFESDIIGIWEKDLHQIFSGDCIRGEWFRPTDRLLRFILEKCTRLDRGNFFHCNPGYAKEFGCDKTNK